MTIATRNRFITVSVLFSILAVLASGTIVVRLLLDNTPPDPALFRRSTLAGLHELYPPYNHLPVLFSIVLFPFISLSGLLYILFGFEKTQSTEITFFATGILALSLESVRLLVPLYELWNHSSFYLLAITRVIIFSRIFVVLSFLCSILIATIQTAAQQIAGTIFILMFIAFSLANRIPLNTETISVLYVLQFGHEGMLYLVLALFGLTAILSYFFQGKTRGIPEYYGAGTGGGTFLCGYALLLISDAWLILAAGSILFVFGIRAYLRNMHRYYMWQ